MTCGQTASTAAGVRGPQANPPGLGPPGMFHAAAPPAAPYDCLAWYLPPFALAAPAPSAAPHDCLAWHLPSLALAASGWGAAAAPAPAPALDGGQPSLTLELRAGRQPMRIQPSLAAVLEGEEEGLSLGLREGPSPPAESKREERSQEPRELGEQVCSPGPPAPVRGSTGATSWTHSWEVCSKVLKSRGSRMASPEFQLYLPGGGEPTKFVLVLSTYGESLGPGCPRGRSSFKRGGAVSIKCKGGPLASSAFDVALWLEGGGQDRRSRDTVRCSFAERSMHEHASWRLQAGPGQTKITVGVRLTVEASVSQSAGATHTCPGGLEPVWRDPASSAAGVLRPGPPPGL